ncbi:MAG: STAS domain-containing protein [Mycobacteriales bacterium]
MELAITTRSVNDYKVVTVAGEIDIFTAPQLRENLVELLDAGQLYIVVDLLRVDFLDSTALGVLVGIHRRVSPSGGALNLVCIKPHILKMFRISGLDQTFAISPTVEQAAAERDGDAR